MRPEKLLSMANQIATFFRSYPEEEGVAGVQHHLKAFWTPVMVSTLRTHLMRDAAAADPLVQEAFRHHAEAESPAEKVLSPVRSSGSMASDAG
jgi:formate dehydrogenase subunit delta